MMIARMIVRTNPAITVAVRLFNRASMPRSSPVAGEPILPDQDSKFITPMKCAF
jgi:hypothetical protein